MSGKRHGTRSLLVALCLVIIALWGCASAPKNDDILALVDGEPVTKGDLEYALQIAHRREDLSTAKTLDISEYVQKLIDDRLIIQEARRMGMDEYNEVKKRVEAYVLRESVVRLYNEEVVGKVSVSDEDIVHYYKENYEVLTLDIIELDSEEKAAGVLEKLKSGERFTEYSQKYPASFAKKDGQEHVFKRKSLGPDIQQTIGTMEAGEISDVIEIGGKYYILRLIERQEASDEDLDGLRMTIERTLKKQRISERSDEYLEQLRNEADVTIHEELLSAIELDQGGEAPQQWSNDNRPLIEVRNDVLTVQKFVAMLPSDDEKTKKRVLKKWLDRKLVDQEALSRHYETDAALHDMVQRYQNQVIKNTFINNIIAPKIDMKEKEIEDYYLHHQEEFVRPVQYKIQLITVKTREEAQDVLDNLLAGADFSFLAKTRSTDPSASDGGVRGWKMREEFDDATGEIIDSLEPGDVSPVVEMGDAYGIIKLMDKTDKEVEEFRKVRERVRRAAYREKFGEIYRDYVSKLKKEAAVEINDEAVRSYEEIIQQ